eukprot:gene11918-13886_t
MVALVIIDLELGRLLRSKDFTFDSATHSLEIMNPKLDSSANAEASVRPETLFDLGKIPRDTTLSIKQIVAVIDRMLGMEVGWMEGNPLSFTLFNCMYMYFPHRLENKYLNAYMHTMLASTETIHSIVSKGDICLEEDFNLATFELPFPPVHTLVLIKNMNDLDKELEQEITSLQAANASQEDINNLCDLRDHMTFRKNLYLLMFSLNTPNLPLAIKSLPQLQAAMASMRNRAANRPSYSDIPAGIFNPSLTNRLTSCMNFPVYEPHAFATLVGVYEKLVTHVIIMLKTPHLLESNRTGEFKIQDILDYHFYFSKMSPNIIVRSVLRRLLFPLPHSTFFLTDAFPPAVISWMAEFGVPQSSLNLQIPEVATFVDRFSHAFQKLLIHLALNRARQRRKLKHSLMDLSIIQNEGDMLDTHFAKNKLQVPILIGSFVLNLKIKVMCHFLSLGFELETYAPHEFQCIYWYLDSLGSVNISVHQYVYNQHCIASGAVSKAKKDAKKAAKKQTKKNPNVPAAPAPAPERQLPPASPERLLIAIHRLLSQGMFRFMTSLEMMGKIKKPKCEFSSPALRFLKRFEFFNNPPYQQPDPLSLEQFQAATDTADYTWFGILSSILPLVGSIKLLLDHFLRFEPAPPFYLMEETKMLQRTTILLSMAVRKLLPKDFEKITDPRIVLPPPNCEVTFEPTTNYPNIIVKQL